MAPALLILAAGMGSRYGGLKQLDPVGPSNETLLDYSVFDALRAGFNRVIFVIRRDFEMQFRDQIGRRYEKQVDVDYVFQGLDVLPGESTVPATRVKPLGTGHAIWCARDQIKTPFAAINADDFYGAEAYRTLSEFFQQPNRASTQFAMVGYRLNRTLSEHGSVARGICRVDAEGNLLSVEERVGLVKNGTGARMTSPEGAIIEWNGNESVSMNFWGFTPAIFPLIETDLKQFLNNVNDQVEFYIPFAVANMIESKSAQVRVLSSESSWFGVTYREDKPLVIESIARLVAKGEYPSPLAGCWQ